MPLPFSVSGFRPGRRLRAGTRERCPDQSFRSSQSSRTLAKKPSDSGC
jgi:hypothetical protein